MTAVARSATLKTPAIAAVPSAPRRIVPRRWFAAITRLSISSGRPPPRPARMLYHCAARPGDLGARRPARGEVTEGDPRGGGKNDQQQRRRERLRHPAQHYPAEALH